MVMIPTHSNPSWHSMTFVSYSVWKMFKHSIYWWTVFMILFSHTACKARILYLLHVTHIESFILHFGNYKLCNWYIQPNRIVVIREKFVHFNFDYTNRCKFGAVKYCRANQSKSTYAINWIHLKQNQINLFLFFIFCNRTDSVCMVVTIDCGQLFLVWSLLLVVV